MATTEGAARDKTEDWLLPAEARPRSFRELEVKIDYAVTLARSSEAAVAEIGAAALDAADGAQRAAELAERAALAAEEAAQGGVALAATPATANGFANRDNPAIFPLPSNEDLQLAHFLERADRVVARLRALEQLAG